MRSMNCGSQFLLKACRLCAALGHSRPFFCKCWSSVTIHFKIFVISPHQAALERFTRQQSFGLGSALQGTRFHESIRRIKPSKNPRLQ